MGSVSQLPLSSYGSITLSSRWMNIMDVMNIMIIMDEYINLVSVSQLSLSSYMWKYNAKFRMDEY